MKIDFCEIKDWQEFEDLVADYFREVKSNDDNNLTDVRVEPSGNGPDGGRDVLLTFSLNDSIISFARKWVVQCKFYKKDVLKSHLKDVHIANIIREHGADGYLLICKNNPHVGVTTLFENLRRQCRDGYHYEVWNGNHFRHRIGFVRNLHKTYFPEYHLHNEEQKKVILESLKEQL